MKIQTSSCKAVIITALPLESKAVRHYLDKLRDVEHTKGTIYTRGQFVGERNTWDVLVAEVGKNNPIAAQETERAIAFHKPSVAFLVGVSGGIKDVKLGDVVVADKVYYYESGKWGEGQNGEAEFYPRPMIHHSGYRLVEQAKALARKDEWQKLLDSDDPEPKPSAIVGPLAAGESVVASKASEVYDLIKKTYGDSIAVAMEDFGFLRAAYANPGVQALVIRGISDLIENKSEADSEGWQKVAALRASAFAFGILLRASCEDQLEKVPSTSDQRGATPRLFNVPFQRNLNFIGRNDILTKLSIALNSRERGGWKQAICGLGGVGKSQLALEYAYLHRENYGIVWWLRSEDPSILLIDYADIAKSLGLAVRDLQNLTEVATAVKKWLEENQGWLLIFDNAQGPEQIKNFLPGDGPGHAIITSRNQEWGGIARKFPIKGFKPEESIEFLLKRTGQDDRMSAVDLAEALGNLPLALEQAAAYIETTSTPLSEYLELFNTRRQELWDEEDVPLDYPFTVATTWSLAMEQICQEAGASDLLSLCAYLAPDNIPLEILTEREKHLSAELSKIVIDRLAFNRVIKTLRRYSLVDFDGKEHLGVHRLVQAVVRDNLGKDQKVWAERAVMLLDSEFHFDEDEMQTWRKSALLLPHALVVAGHAEKSDAAPGATQHLLNTAGLFLLNASDFLESKSVLERALFLAEKVYGKKDPAVASIVNNLGLVLLDIGELKQARDCFQRALIIDEKALGTDHASLGRDVNNLGLILKELDEFEEAEEEFRRALEINERALGPEHPQVAVVANNLGLVQRAQSRPEEARKNFEKALKISELKYKKDHPKVATYLNNLGLVLEDMGELQEARKCFERVLEIDEKVYGQDNPKIAIALNNLGDLLRRLDEPEEAKKKNLQKANEYLVKALKISEKAYEPNHPQVAIYLNVLGLILRDLGELEEAEEKLEKAVEINLKVYGPESTKTATMIFNLGLVLQDMGDPEGAKKNFEVSLRVFQKNLGNTHPSTIKVQNNLTLLSNLFLTIII